VPYNVVAQVEAPTGSGFKVDPWSVEESNAFMEAVAGDWLAPLYLFAIGSGARVGECRGLAMTSVVPWKFDEAQPPTVTIKEQRTRKATVRATKSKDSGSRTFVATELAAYAIRAQRLQRAEAQMAAGETWQESGFVFVQRNGKPLDWRSVNRSFVAIQKRVGARHQRFHDLRHAFATQMLTAGVPLVVVSKMMGHKDVGITADLYGHLVPQMTIDAAEKFNALPRPSFIRRTGAQ
jgi:integrase